MKTQAEQKLNKVTTADFLVEVLLKKLADNKVDLTAADLTDLIIRKTDNNPGSEQEIKNRNKIGNYLEKKGIY